MRVYFAAPLFSCSERRFNSEVASMICDLGVKVFLPQRDGMLIPDLLAEGCCPQEAVRRIYSADIEAIKECEVVVAVLDGRTVDEGVAFEIGFAKALGKRCIAVQTDFRRLIPIGNNPMIDGSIDSYCLSVDDLASKLARLMEMWRSEGDLTP